MENREDWRRREWEGRENESFWNRERDARERRPEEGWRRDFDREDDRPGGLTAVSWAAWTTQAGSPSGYAPWDRSFDVPRGRYTGRGPKNYQRSNERIREDVCERLTDNPDLDASEIEIRVDDREVTLDGKVEDRHAKRLAEDLAESVAGVKDVHNHLKVEEGFFSKLFGRDEKEHARDRDEDRARRIPIASDTTAAVDRPGGSTAVTAVGDTAVTGTDRTAAVSDTTPPSMSSTSSSTSRSRPRR